MMNFENTAAFAKQMDDNDPLKNYKEKFLVPHKDVKPITYFCGNSLGLQPKSAALEIQNQLNIWESFAVEGWFEGENNWLNYHHDIKDLLAPIVGAKPAEVTCMNSLTINLHLMLTSFYIPNGKKNKIIIEGGAFPSDQYAIESFLQTKGLSYQDTVIEVIPSAQNETLTTDEILAVINKHQHEIALIMFGGVNYYTGQFFDLEEITKAGHNAGALVGFDLAHAVGNVPLKLHQWGVDFACWCSYKYLNSGPGGIGGIFVNEKHFNKPINRLAGWWGYNLANRFKMEKGFVPEFGAEGWQVSTSPILIMATHKVALNIFKEAGFENLVQKSQILTQYLEFIINQVNLICGEQFFKIITPKDINQRGAQLSISCKNNGKKIFDQLVANNIICDWREPNVIRISPVPLYNSYSQVYQLGKVLEKCLIKLKQ